MRFYRKRGKQILDLRDDFILTRQSDLVEAQAKSNAPRLVRFARYVPNIGKQSVRAKIRTSWRALQFIWTEGNV